jgi:hypothetical protein
MSRGFQHETYLARAMAVNVSADVAEAELAAVMSEVHDPTTALVVDVAEAYAIAWRRLIGGGPRHRPNDEVRTSLRSMYPEAHPDWIDQIALQIAPDETLAKALLSHPDYRAEQAP